MKLSKMIGSVLITASLFGVSLIASAEDVKFSNFTPYNLSFSTNGVCSQALGDLEVHTIKIINQTSFEDICKYNPNQCSMDVYYELGCAGRVVANMVFDKTKVISTASSDVIVSANGSNIFFNIKQ